MNDKTLYYQLLGLNPPWEVEEVHLNIGQEEIEVFIHYQDNKAPCPKCKESCSIYDKRESRKWRHLDTCQMKTWLICRLPRVSCPKHGILTVEAPWSQSKSHFTQMFEKLAIDLLSSFKKQTKVANLLRISFDQLHLIMKQSVDRGLACRDNDQLIDYVGLDEKSFRSHHRYASVLVDLDNTRVINLVESRDEESAANLLKGSLNQKQREHLKAICMDMWKPYMSAASKCLPKADIVHDRFHLVRYLNQAVDETRRQEIKSSDDEQKALLKNTRYLFLSNRENWSTTYKTRFQKIQHINLKTSDAWRIKENFKSFFLCDTLREAKLFFAQWFNDVEEVNLDYVKKVAKMFLKHIIGIINYVRHRITNALVESMNSLIQEIKYVARGFRSFENFKICVLFFLGKLNLYSQKNQ